MRATTWLVFLMLVVLAGVAGCGGRTVLPSEQPPLDGAAYASAAGNPLAGITFPPRETSTYTMYFPEVQDCTGQSGTEAKSWSDMSYLLFQPPAGGIAWASYAYAIPEGERLYDVSLDVDDENLDDENMIPALPYWIGVANYQKGCWEWYGPYNDLMATAELDNSQPRETYVSPGGQAHWVVLSYCAPEQTPAGMALIGVYPGTNDQDPGVPPY